MLRAWLSAFGRLWAVPVMFLHIFNKSRTTNEPKHDFSVVGVSVAERPSAVSS